MINHTDDLKSNYNFITDSMLNNEQFLERVLKVVNKNIWSVLKELDFESEQFLILNKVNITLDDVAKETATVYHASVIDDKGEHPYTTNREQHLIGILEWAHEYIVGNIEVEE
ncbi:type II toxin-antitoxin system antitoxin, TscA family [Staphylococcus xylosus]|uniref:TscA family type II toxin-antitoxin system antitoxin n=1 Tax=Staphylococcus xylosus TaxID=1288 RepID=UPI00217506E2|nr:pathogenicity island protein [Staphylococcus xylosus]